MLYKLALQFGFDVLDAGEAAGQFFGQGAGEFVVGDADGFVDVAQGVFGEDAVFGMLLSASPLTASLRHGKHSNLWQLLGQCLVGSAGGLDLDQGWATTHRVETAQFAGCAVLQEPHTYHTAKERMRVAWRLPKRWLVLAVLLGVLAGVGGFTFKYAEGLSYLSNDPKTCVNCHIMNDQYDSWRKGPHHAAATCNDCHVPPQFPEKYIAKAENGYHHSWGFTFQPNAPDEPGARQVIHEPIQIKAKNSQILQDNCLRCHGDFVHDIVRGSTWDDDAIRCVHCHRGVGHGARR